MKRIIALTEAIESFKSQLAEGPRNAIGEIELARCNGYLMLNQAKLRERGVYIYTDMCDQLDPFKSRPDGSPHTAIRYIGSTTNTFEARYADHKKRKRFKWAWWEIICVSREYWYFAPSLEGFLLQRFHPTDEESAASKRARIRNDTSTWSGESQEEWQTRRLSWFGGSMFDETTDKPSALHKKYFQFCGI